MPAARQTMARTQPETLPPDASINAFSQTPAVASQAVDLASQVGQTLKSGEHASPPAPGMVRVRVLVDGHHGACNEVIEIEAELVPTLAGVVDADPAAVAYAESLIKE